MANRRLARWLVLVILLMAGASFAAVPFYSWFCRVTGFAGTPQLAQSGNGAPVQMLPGSEITIRFDSNTAPGMPWQFRPVERQMRLRIGETGLAFYEAYNPTDRAVTGQAGFNVAPDAAGAYFTKVDCFCFTEQLLAPGERVQMPVSFYVDPAMLDDPDAAGLHRITLSYTFYEIPAESGG